MQKVIYIALVVLVLTGTGFAINYSKKLNKCEADFYACKKVPDFTPALFNVKEFIGARKKIHFKIKCSNDVEFDFFDTQKCTVLIDADITGKDIELTYDKYDGTLGGSSYIVDWLEYWNFYIDLSDSRNWQIESENKVISFNAPQIEVSRLGKNGKDYLLYATDRAIWSNDQKALVNMAVQTDDFSILKSTKYLKEHYAEITDEMKISITEFIKTLITKLGYPEGYVVQVNFEPLP